MRPARYDPSDEEWEFVPGSVVSVEKMTFPEGDTGLLATSLVRASPETLFRLEVARAVRALLSARGDGLAVAIPGFGEGVLVYEDLGGALYLATPGVVALETDEDIDAVHQGSKGWLIAIVAASERYEELACLLPARGPHTIECRACAGARRLLGLRCGSCFGLGWTGLDGKPA